MKFPKLVLISFVVALVSCGSSQKFRASVAEDKPLFGAINELNKHPENKKAQEDLKLFYEQSVRHHEQAIDAQRNSQDPRKWDRILKEYNSLQNIYSSISSVPGALSILRPENYTSQIEDVKQKAAEDFYNHGVELMGLEGRDNKFRAYESFKQSQKYGNHKDVANLVREAYERSVINVVINPIEEDRFGYGRFGNWNSSARIQQEDFQRSLVRDLANRSGSGRPARFYTDFEARRNDIQPDWVVDIAWQNIDALNSIPRRYSRRVSRDIQVGSDTSGKPIHKTVYATLQITQRNYTVRAAIDYRIRDLEVQGSIDQGYVSDDVNWNDTYATYSGDSRALGPEEWNLVNNSRYNYTPSRYEVMNTLMQRLYPELRRRIENSIQFSYK